jgi:hypothetical protein
MKRQLSKIVRAFLPDFGRELARARLVRRYRSPPLSPTKPKGSRKPKGQP